MVHHHQSRAECGAVVAAVYDILAGTPLAPLAPILAWDAVNQLRPVAGAPGLPVPRHRVSAPRS